MVVSCLVLTANALTGNRTTVLMKPSLLPEKRLHLKLLASCEKDEKGKTCSHHNPRVHQSNAAVFKQASSQLNYYKTLFILFVFALCTVLLILKLKLKYK